MLISQIYITCDGCKAPFPSYEGAAVPQETFVFTPRALRTEARKCGWQRYDQKDYCPTCETNHRSEVLAGKGRC